ncbi:dihydrodipicolinate synthase family protein [candidate division KSB1 bacterium]|nr:dihydrodipicolinate synthase family protein [candidate division KSB1 bacterium]
MSNEFHKKYRGVVAPVLTPFKEDKSIDFPTYEKFVDWLCEQKLNILFPMGGSGEYQTLSVDERKEIIDTVVNISKGRKLFIAGTGASCLKDTIELSKYAEKKGADGVGVVMPTDISDEKNALFEYYKAVDDVISIPMMVYDPRGEGPHSASPEWMRCLIDELKNLVAIKYRTVNGEFMGSMAREIAADISILSGAESVYLQDLSVGAVGCVGGGGNFYPNVMWELQDKFEKGDIITARKIQYKILEALEALSKVYWPLCGKVVLQELGFPFKLVTRVKGSPFAEQDVENIRKYYRNILKL